MRLEGKLQVSNYWSEIAKSQTGNLRKVKQIEHKEEVHATKTFTILQLYFR